MTHGDQICQLCQPINVLFHYFTSAAILASTCHPAIVTCPLFSVAMAMVSLNVMTPAVEHMFCPLCESVKESRREVHPCQWKTGSMYVMFLMEVCMPKLPSTTESPYGQGPIPLATSRLVLPYPIQKWYGFGSASARDGHFTVGEDIYHQRREDFQDMSLGHRPVAIAATVMLRQIPGAANYIHDVGYCARGRWYESYAGMLQLRGDHWSVHVVELFAWHVLLNCIGLSKLYILSQVKVQVC